MDILKDLAKRNCKILVDTKAPRDTSQAVAAKIPVKAEPEKPLSIHQAFVKKTIKEKPAKKKLVEFFKDVVEQEEQKL
jgi:hypothetical protein